MGKEKLSELTARLTAALETKLVSVVLYGSAAGDGAEDQVSDLNVLCVLNQVGPEELAAAEPVMRWWREANNPPVLLLTEEEVQTSTDCFPMEFHDMHQHRRILAGKDILSSLAVDDRYYRAHVEHELRAKLLRLRQRGAEVLPDSKRLVRLMVDSLSTFCVLGRHSLVLSGRQPRWQKQEVIEALGAATGQPFRALNEILAIRTSSPTVPDDARQLFGRYLADVDRLVRFVDSLGHEYLGREAI